MNENKEVIEFLVQGGKAAPGPSTAPKLSELGLNIGEVFKKINELTKDFEGMEVPVKIIVDKKTKEYEVCVGTPPTSSLLKREAGIEVAKLSEDDLKKGVKYVANISFENVLKVVKMKMNDLTGDIKAKIKQVLGTCLSLHFSVDEKDPREVINDVNEGKYDEKIKEFFKES